MKAKLRIFIADDHAMIREGLKSLVNAQPDMEVIGEADNGRTAWRLAKELEPDVVVMDVSMPVLNGIRATTLIKRVCKNVKVMVLTVHEDQGYLRQLLEAGASGYVLKNAAADELIEGLRVVASGRVYLDPTQASKVVGGFVGKRGVKGRESSTTLSDREREVLRLVAWGYANKEIAGRLDISVKTVETHKANVMEKLDLKSRSDFVRYALHQGWLEEP